MEQREYKIMESVETTSWWWLGRRKVVEFVMDKFLPKKKLTIADFGAGFGGNIAVLRQYGDVTALEMDSDAVEAIKKYWGPSVDVVQWKYPQHLDKKFDFIILADVLEHIEDDKGAVQWIYDHLEHGGHALFTVPAFKFFWTEMDEVAFHFRRYDSRILNLFHQFSVIKFTYYNFFLFPIKALFVLFTKIHTFLFPKAEKRSWNDVVPKMSLINQLAKWTLYTEAELIRHISLPFGAGIVLLVKKEN